MRVAVTRRTVDLSAYPDLVVIYLGMRVNVLSGLKTLAGYGRGIDRAVAARPEGLLLHEALVYSLLPPHVGMRPYWRDFESLERWTRSEPHRLWWEQFVHDPGGTGFWHEMYFKRGGMEAVYLDMPVPVGFMKFAPEVPARGSMFAARHRLGLSGSMAPGAPVTEAGMYGENAAGAAKVPRV